MSLHAVVLLAAVAASAQLPQKDLSGIHRLNAPGWEGLPALMRVIVLPGPRPAGRVRVVYWRSGEPRLGELPEAAVEPDQSSAAAGDAKAWKAFLLEARMNVLLARGLDGGEAKDFSRFLGELDARLLCFAKEGAAVEAAWPGLRARAAKDFSVNLADKPAELARLKGLIFSVLNPRQGERDLASETLLIPLSKEWFLKFPALAEHYKKEFLGGGFDVRIEGGSSGEGLNRSDSGDFSGFLAYQKTLLKLKVFVAGLNDPAVAATPEARWLAGLSEESFKRYQRMIFIHEHTWAALGSGRHWAEFIAVDQSFPGLPSNDLLSVLIHEINVNSHSPHFLPGDTHLEESASRSMWGAVAKNGVGQLKDAATQRIFFGLNPFTSAIYLGYYAQRLAEAVPACR